MCVSAGRSLLLCVSLALPWAGTTVTPDSDATDNGWLKGGWARRFPRAGQRGLADGETGLIAVPRGLSCTVASEIRATGSCRGHILGKVAGRGVQPAKWRMRIVASRVFCDCVGT